MVLTPDQRRAWEEDGFFVGAGADGSVSGLRRSVICDRGRAGG